MFKSSKRPLATGASAVFTFADYPTGGQDFLWVDRFGEPYVAFRDRAYCWLLPRECFPVAEDDQRVSAPVQFERDARPRDDSQRRVLKESFDFLMAGRSHQVRASTGWGKTWLACALMSHLGQRTLVIVPKSDGFKDWHADIQQFLHIEPGYVGHIQADRCVVGEHVTIATLQSICKENRYPQEVYDSFGLVVFDEVDRLGADHFQDAAFNLPARLRLGLSATARKDGRQDLVEAHCGPVLVKHAEVPMRPQVLRYHTGWRCPRDKKTRKTIPHEGGRDMHVVKILSRSVRRNKLILSLIQACLEKERHVLVFSHLREHLDRLAGVLCEAGFPKEDIGFYQGGEKSLDEAAHRRVTLATYKMAGRGTNFPHWEVCILATPIADPAQACGRVLRKAEGKKQPAIIDLVDDDSPLYKGYMFARDKFYRSPEVDADPISECD